MLAMPYVAETGGIGCVCAMSNLLENVRSGRLRSGRMEAASQRLGCRLQRARPLGKPVAPDRPPRALLPRRSGLPCVGLVRQVRVAEERRPLGAGRIDDALDVAARAEDEFATTAEDVCRRIARLPGRDVVGDTGDDEAVARDLGEI